MNDVAAVGGQVREPGKHVEHLKPKPVLDEAGEGQ